MRWIELAVGLVVVGTLGVVRAPAPSRSSADAFRESYQLEASQDYQGAIRTLTAAHPSSSRNYLLQLRLGWLYYLQGSHANALRHYQAAVLLSPRAVEPRLGQMLPLLAQGKYAEVEVLAREVLKLDGNHYTASLRLAYALRRQGKLPQAEQVNDQMLRLYPTDVAFLVEQGYTYLAERRSADAARVFAEVLLLVPEHPDAVAGLALAEPQ